MDDEPARRMPLAVGRLGGVLKLCERGWPTGVLESRCLAPTFLVASDIPAFHEPGSSSETDYKTEQVVWREAKTLRELARSERLPAMSKGAALSPGAKGAIYYPGAGGQVIELRPHPRKPPQRAR